MRLFVLTSLFICGCASLSEEEIYQREDALIIAQENYQVRRRICADAGGFMYIATQSASKFRKTYSKFDYNFARCIRWN